MRHTPFNVTLLFHQRVHIVARVVCAIIFVQILLCVVHLGPALHILGRLSAKDVLLAGSLPADVLTYGHLQVRCPVLQVIARPQQVGADS